MEELLACRVCLATDGRLFDMFKYNLVSTYEVLIGTEISLSDGLPHQLCSYCCALLLKCAAFQRRSRSSQRLLSFAALQQELITTDYIRNIDRETHNLSLPYCVKTDTVIIKEELYKENNPAHNIDETSMRSQIKFEERISSDDEPLSKKVKKKRKKKRKVEEQTVNLDIKEETDFQIEGTDLNDDFDNTETNLNDEKVDCDYLEFSDDIEVITLTKAQQIEEILSRKNSLNYLNSMFKCNKCYKGFMTSTTYRNHMVRHDPASGAHACPVCATRWAGARALRAHALAAHERQFLCRRCGHVAKSSHRAKEHCKWHEGYTYTCNICGATFSKSTSHLTHIRLRHPSGHACDICGESFIGEFGLNMHRKKAHKSSEQNARVKSESRCDACGELFRSADALLTHASRAAEGVCDTSLRWCSQCGAGCVSEESLSEHLREQHTRNQAVTCVQCGRVFASPRTHAVHFQHFHARAPHAPRRRARARRAAVCEVCGRQCVSKASLLYHQRTHTGEKPYQCTECPKRFSILQRLQIHQRTHTGERPFKCALCPKAFKQKAALNRHDRVHTGSKPYCCAHCGKSFSQSNSLKTHVRTVHLKLPAPYRQPKRDKLMAQ